MSSTRMFSLEEEAGNVPWHSCLLRGKLFGGDVTITGFQERCGQREAACVSQGPENMADRVRGGELRRALEFPPCARVLGSRDVGFTAVELARQVARRGTAGNPHHGELLGVARHGAGVGTVTQVLAQHGICRPPRRSGAAALLWGALEGGACLGVGLPVT